MALFGYARVSSDGQDLRIQESALRAAGCQAIRSEKKSATGRTGRSELQILLDFLREGDTLVVTRIDRLARSMKDLQDIVHELKGRGVALKATEQPIDTGTAAGKAFLDMLGVFAEFETNLRRERQAEGIAAAKARFGEDRANIWKPVLEQGLATETVRKQLLTPNDTLVDADEAAVRRDFLPPAERTLAIKNVVVILMESFAGHSVGALGSPNNITPYFDKLAKEGLLFDRFFSNGTHTHQGMFATMACFPNLPGFEYLMQTPEGGHKLSGLPALLSARDYDDVYVYNGDFAWDNQSGFFGNQGMTTFIGRNDFVNPVFSDPTWGVSDQDMFDRGNEELAKHDGKKPIYALLQTLSNHTPYALPKDLPVEKVTGQGRLDEHLTAMRYSDWALGQFFEKARKEPYFKDTLFVIVGDHGFGNHQQVTELDLGRFNVPLLLIAPGIQEKFGAVNHTVGTQVDIVPTIMGRLGGKARHQCWGRDLLNLPEGDQGVGMIKPSGSEQIVGLVQGDRILIESKDMTPRMYRYQLGSEFKAELIESPDQPQLLKQLEAYIQTATKSLLDNTAGVVHGTPK